MAISFIADSSYASNASTSVSISKPASTSNNDCMIAFVSAQQGTAHDIAITPPAGWTIITSIGYTPVNSGSQAKLYAYWKIAASEGSSYSFTCTGTSVGGMDGMIRTYRGTSTSGSPINSSNVVANSIFASSVVIPALTETFVSGEWYVGCYIGTNNATYSSSSPTLSHTGGNAGAFESYAFGDLIPGSAPGAQTITSSGGGDFMVGLGFSLLPPGSTSPVGKIIRVNQAIKRASYF